MFFTRYCQPPTVAISCAESTESEESLQATENNREIAVGSSEKKQEVPLATALVQEGF
jgi:hypothetical protein